MAGPVNLPPIVQPQSMTPVTGVAPTKNQKQQQTKQAVPESGKTDKTNKDPKKKQHHHQSSNEASDENNDHKIDLVI